MPISSRKRSDDSRLLDRHGRPAEALPATCPTSDSCPCASASSPPSSRRSPRPAGWLTSPARCAAHLHARGSRRPSVRAAARADQPARRRRSQPVDASAAASRCRSATRSSCYDVRRARLPGIDGAVYLVDCPELFDRPQIYHDAPDEHSALPGADSARRSNAASAWASQPHIVHCNDWHTALVPLLLRTTYAWDTLFRPHAQRASRSTTSATRACFSASHAADLGCRRRRRRCCTRPTCAAGAVNLAAHGVMYADAVTTVSPTYAREIRTPDARLRPRRRAARARRRRRRHPERRRLRRVESRDRPRTCRTTTAPTTSRARRSTSARCSTGCACTDRRERAADRHGLAADGAEGHRPAVRRAARSLIETRELRFVALGNGEARYEQFFDDLQQRFPGRVVFHRGYSEELAHCIEAGSDMFLMPSLLRALRAEPDVQPDATARCRSCAAPAGWPTPCSTGTRDTGDGTGVVFNDFDARRPALGARHRARVVRVAATLEAAHAQRHGAGFLLAARRSPSTSSSTRAFSPALIVFRPARMTCPAGA